MDWLEDGGNSHVMKKFDFQFYVLHLNHKLEQDKWKIGHYLFVIHQDVAYEIFKVENTEIRKITNFSPDRIPELSLKLGDQITDTYKKYIKKFGT